VGYRKYCMDIDSEEQEAPKDEGTYPSSLVVLPSNYQEELVEPVDLPRDVSMTRKRHAWLCDTLQDAKRHAAPVVLSGSVNNLKGSQVIWN
jgi:hypothetical protein